MVSTPEAEDPKRPWKKEVDLTPMLVYLNGFFKADDLAFWAKFLLRGKVAL